MSNRGIVRNGMVEFDRADHLTDGTYVYVPQHAGGSESTAETGRAEVRLVPSGTARNLLACRADQHDHTDHGTPKR